LTASIKQYHDQIDKKRQELSQNPQYNQLVAMEQKLKQKEELNDKLMKRKMILINVG
jgi:hypothetical protein